MTHEKELNEIWSYKETKIKDSFTHVTKCKRSILSVVFNFFEEWLINLFLCHVYMGPISFLGSICTRQVS